MGKLQFQLDFLDDIVRQLLSLASAHDDLSRAIASHARTVQARGGSSGVSDQLIHASSILGSHREALQSESANLRDRLVVARSTAEGWDGNQADLRIALAGIITSGAGAAASQVKGAGGGSTSNVLNESLAVVLLAGAKGMASLSNKAGGSRSNDCVQYVTAVMQKMGISTRPGDGGGNIYSSAAWTAAGFAHVASGTAPPPGSFFEMGQNGGGGYHHAGIYLGSKGGVAYVAQSNWGSGATMADRPPAVFKVGANGNPKALSPAEVQALSNTTLGSDAGAAASLQAMWHKYGAAGGVVPNSDNVVNFYTPPSR